ncbi:DNA mismatch repair protein MutS [Mediannikoviicoccus vaginalis]|uniref:DNA mismatch repair protein MutS n=1 Tax=Mediannikoviicoccus vaginalis TaxID=2899727 RepID=UPI001F02785D|nr:DNA mismatch repair protein MutS [Mediannikoviicoccus vaginalis]
MENLTPMMQQYMKVKEENKDCILFFRLGDFYEMFFDDAITASRELEIALTKRDCGNNQKCPMCGIPYHVADTYISKLVEKGYKVAICEQLEDPKEAKGIVKRGIIDKVTPGTIINKESTDSSDFNYLMAIYFDDNIVTLAYSDILDGNIHFTKIRYSNYEELEKKIENEMIKVSPSEIIYNENKAFSQDFLSNLAELNNITLTTSENIDTDEHLKIINEKEITSELKDLKSFKAISMLLSYIYNYRSENLTHIKNAYYFEVDKYLNIDSHTIINLEIHKNLSTESKRGSLYSILNKTSTSMGSRLLHSLLERPLMDKKEIINRQEIVNSFYNSRALQNNISNLLKEIYDLERLIGKLSFGRANARDLVSLKISIEKLPEIKRVILENDSKVLKSMVDKLDTLTDIYELLNNSIVEEPPILITEGNIIKVGFDAHLDEVRDNRIKGKKRLIEYEIELKEETGIKNLKVVFNKKLGYFIDVTKSNLKFVPDYFERKQTLTNSERFITPELKEIENMILSSDSEIVNLEYEIFNRIRLEILDCINRIKETSKIISEIDVFNSLAIVAYENKYVRPNLNNIGLIQISGGRHPIVENSIGLENFISNDTTIGLGYNDIQILTGPNMSGKSTYLRQIAIIVIMAQIGSFVPADEANISIVDKIFTRIGASDNLYKGESTFMVEMNEVSNIIKNSTKDSLLILDEVGRGTSTFDGLSIAWAVLEYISKKIKAKTLFATHYHELTELEGKMDNIINLKVKIQENKDGIVFLRKIVEGKSNRSYGIEVAKIAGLPLELTNRAQKILSNIERERENDSEIIEESLFDMSHEEVDSSYEIFIDKIRNVNVNMLTPMQALTKLDEIIKEAKDL